MVRNHEHDTKAGLTHDGRKKKNRSVCKIAVTSYRNSTLLVIDSCCYIMTTNRIKSLVPTSDLLAMSLGLIVYQLVTAAIPRFSSPVVTLNLSVRQRIGFANTIVA